MRFGLVHADGFEDHNILVRLVVTIFGRRSNFVDNLHSRNDFAESGIIAIEESIVFIANEELAACAVRILGPRHRNHPSFMREIIFDAVTFKFAFDRIIRSARANTIGIAALNHKAFNNPMENQAIVKALVDQIDEISASVRRIFVVQFKLDIAEILDRKNYHVFYLLGDIIARLDFEISFFRVVYGTDFF